MKLQASLLVILSSHRRERCDQRNDATPWQKRKPIVKSQSCETSHQQFLEHLRRSNDLSRRYVINFSRALVFGSGAGHHSPIGGYLEAEDLVLMLDVNSKFQSWLIERSRLFSAMDTLDGDQKRGLLLIEDVKAAR